MTADRPVVIHRRTVPISRESPMKHYGEIAWQGVLYEYEYTPVALQLSIWRRIHKHKSVVRYDRLHAAVRKHYQKEEL